MKQVLLLVISVYILGPICVDCYLCHLVESITLIGELTGDDECTKGRRLLEGDLDIKCNQAKVDVNYKGEKIRKAINKEKLRTVGKYNIEGRKEVVALLVHDNPIIILTSTTHVYAKRTI